VFLVLTGLVGFGAAAGALSPIGATFSIKRTLTHSVFAKQIDSSVTPKLVEFFAGVSKSIGAKKPENIVVGLEPNFFATAATLKLVGEGKPLSGEFLYLSLPLMRLFNVSELRAVMGHELGHFKGADVAYSLKFAPVYRGLSHAIFIFGGR
jgi:Zn-dependent protease with chaperone function